METIDRKRDAIFLVLILAIGGEVGPSGPTTACMRRFARLIDVLRTKLEQHGPSSFRGILFVQQKLTTHILKHLLDRTPALSALLRTACIYATAGEATPWLRVTASQSKARVAQFSSGMISLRYLSSPFLAPTPTPYVLSPSHIPILLFPILNPIQER